MVIIVAVQNAHFPNRTSSGSTTLATSIFRKLHSAMKKIGYPCQNWSEKLTTGHSFKLKSYSDDKLKEVVASNIADLKKMLAYNIKNKISFLRISSGFVPFASHPICKSLAFK